MTLRSWRIFAFARGMQFLTRVRTLYGCDLYTALAARAEIMDMNDGFE